MSLPRALAALLVLTGCPASGNGYGSTTSAIHRTVTASGSGPGGATSGATTGSTAASTTSGGSTGGSSGGSTTGGVACDDAWVTSWVGGGYLPAPGECPTDQVELKGRLTNACDPSGVDYNSPITGSFTATDALNPSVNASTGPCGVFWFCVDAGSQLTPIFTAAGFIPFQLATLALPQSPSVNDDQGASGLSLACTAALSLEAGLLQPMLSLQLPIVYVTVEPNTYSSNCDDLTGWSFTLYGPDGGALDPPSATVIGEAFVQNDAGTGGLGVEVFYNLDSALPYVTVSGDRPGNDLPDGGELCPDLRSATGIADFTGRVPIALSTLTQVLYVVP